MKKNHLQQFEYDREQVLGSAEMKRLLGNKDEYQTFLEENQESLQKAYGASFQADFRKDMELKLQTIDRFTYLNSVEGFLRGAISDRIKKMGEGVRSQVEVLLEGNHVIDMTQEEWQIIQGAPTQLVKGGMFNVSSELVDKYEQVVQEEVRLQLKNVQILDDELKSLDLKDETVQIRLKEHFSRASSLVGLMKKFGKEKSLISSPTLEDRYLEAHMFESLMKDVRQGKNVAKAISQINEIYSTLQSDLEQGTQFHEGLNKMYQEMTSETKKTLSADFSAFAAGNNLKLSPEEAMTLLISEDVLEDGESVAELITGALKDIKAYEFEIFLLDFSDRPEEEKRERVEKIEKENEMITEKILDWIKKFQYGDSKPSKQVDSLPEDIASTDQKKQLRYIAESFDNDETGQQLRDELSALTSTEETRSLIESYQNRVKQEMMEKLGKTEEQVEKYLMSHPRANIFIAYRSFNKHQAKLEDEAMKDDQLETHQLQSIQSEIATLENISNTMGEEGDLSNDEINAYSKALENIFYHAGLPKDYFEKKGKFFYENPIPSYVNEFLKKIPPFEQAQISYFQENHPTQIMVNYQVLNGHFKNSLNLSKEDLDVKDPKNIKTFFTTFLKEYNTMNGVQLPNANPNQVASYYTKMSTMMTLDHPLTCMRFMTDKNLFMHDGVPLYNHHDVNDRGGKPASFRERSQDFMKKLMLAIKTRNVMEMGTLMSTIGAGLISDVEWFPLEKLKDQKETNRLMKNVQDYRPGAFPDYDVEADDQKQYEDDFKDNYPELRNLNSALVDDECYADVFMSGAEAMELAQEMGRNEPSGGQMVDYSGLSLALKKAAEEGSTAGAGAGVLAGTPDVYTEHLKKIGEELSKKDKELGQNVGEYGQTMGRVKTYVPRAASYVYTRAKHYPLGMIDQYFTDYAKNSSFLPPMSLFILVQKAWENMSQRQDSWVEMHANQLGQNIFKGTFMEPEFAKNYQDNENARVSFYKDAMKDFGHTQVLDRLYNPSEMFEFKAAVEELFETRGYCNVDALLDPRVIARINEYSNLSVPTGFTREQVLNDEEIADFMYGKIGAAIDQLWGDGTFQDLRNKATSTFDSKKNEYKSSAETMTGDEKLKKLTSIWNGLTSAKGMQELKEMHPAEMYGVIEWEMLEGGQDAGMTFGLMQALIIKGIIPSNLVRKLQNAHSNDLPSYTIMEPMQARYAGLDVHLEKALKNGKSYEDNDFIKFFDGGCTLKLRGTHSGGKWGFPKTRDKYEDALKNPDYGYGHITVHEVQLSGRQAQVNYHREMDNSCIHVFSPSYGWSEIEQGLTKDTNGVINARPHDIVAAYRGVQDRFTAQMNHLAEAEDQLDFDRTCYYAYKMIALTCGYASYLSRTPSRHPDYELHKDGSINYAKSYTDKFDRGGGSTNYERLIMGNTGTSQRLGQSAKMMDASEAVGGDLRTAMKNMAGYQYISSLGVGEDGISDPGSIKPYLKDEYNPADGFKETIKQFKAQVERMASAQGFRANICSPSDGVPDAGLNNLTDPNRMTKMDQWRIKVAKLK